MEYDTELYVDMGRFLNEMAGRQLGIEAWLNALGLQEYTGIFSSYSRVEELLSMSEADIRDLGVKNSAHRARVVSSLVMLRDKVQRKAGGYRTKTPPGVSPIHSNSASPPSLVAHPDYAALQLPYQPLNPNNPLSPAIPTANPPQLAGPASDNAHDLKNYLWFHGSIPRGKAEVLVCKDGDFLVRESISQPGDYVLTVRWRGSPLHFVINRQVAGEDSGGNPKVSYQFEEHMFDRVAELVQFYIANKKQVSEMSGAVMLYPINRIQAVDPKLSYGHAPAVGLRAAHSLTGGGSGGGSGGTGSPRPSPLTTPTQSPPALRRQGRSGSQPLLSLDDVDGGGGERRGSLPPMRVGNTPGSGDEGGAPPKPSLGKSRRPVVAIRNRALYEDDGKDYTDYAQVKSWASAVHRRQQLPSEGEGEDNDYDNNFGGSTYPPPENDYDVPRSNAPYIAQPSPNTNPAAGLYDVPRSLSIRPAGGPARVPPGDTQEDGGDSGDDDVDGGSSGGELLRTSAIPPRTITSPNMDAESCFDYGVFSSGLLPKDNKALDSGSITTLKTLILDSEPRMLAQHLTYVDLEILKVMGQHDLGMGVFSGLELLTLPQGHRLRQDLIERHHSLKLFVTLMIVTSIKYPERARMLHQWIQVALELKNHLGNLYGFGSVMAGLRSPQVMRLKNTWLSLRQANHNSYMVYESQLLPLHRALDDGGTCLPLHHVTIPYVLPLVEILERTEEDNLETWEESKADYGLEVLLTHLDMARVVTEQCGLYRVTSENAFRDFLPDRRLEDAFRTELHLKVMWGAGGARTVRSHRHTKFSQVLSVLSERVEPPQASLDQETSV